MDRWWRGVAAGLVLAFALWHMVFHHPNPSSFWVRVTGASIALALWAHLAQGKTRLKPPTRGELALGILHGAALYGLFYGGYYLLEDLVAEGASNVYRFRAEAPLTVPMFLLVATSLCEEYFWRHYTQGTLAQHLGKTKGLLLTTTLYALIHLTTRNTPLVLAALIAGAAWGALYESTGSLWAAVFSHMVWTELVFVWKPLGG